MPLTFLFLFYKIARLNPLDSLTVLSFVTHVNHDVCNLVLQGATVSTATCVQLHKRAEKITAALLERGGINTGDNVVLLYPPGTVFLPDH